MMDMMDEKKGVYLSTIHVRWKYTSLAHIPQLLTHVVLMLVIVMIILSLTIHYSDSTVMPSINILIKTCSCCVYKYYG